MIALTGTALLMLSTLAQAGIDRNRHFTRDYAYEVLEATRQKIETELRSNLNVREPQLYIDEAGEFGVDHSPVHVETHASHAGPGSAR